MFRNKEYIYQVYKEKSFGKAAENLHVSQPSLSAVVKRLETQLGMPIFDRKTVPVSLTPFGAEYIKCIETVQSLEEHINNITYQAKNFQTGHLSISASNLSFDYIVTETIGKFKMKYPKIDLNIIGTTTIRSKQMLDSHEIDLFITTRPMDDQEYEKIFFYDDQLILIVPVNNPINKQYKEFQLSHSDLKNIFQSEIKGLPLYLFRELPFFLSDRNNFLRSCTDTLFREAGFEPAVILEVEEAATSLSFAKYGIGATICNHRIIERMDYENNYCLYKLDSKYVNRRCNVCYHKNAYVTPAMSAFLDTVKIAS